MNIEDNILTNPMSYTIPTLFKTDCDQNLPHPPPQLQNGRSKGFGFRLPGFFDHRKTNPKRKKKKTREMRIHLVFTQ
ncbi:hypothetical protein MKW98_027156 [Papaver atlanticum]|uniref:Uncharacterized protein n=1 Tax=Papaver atlanticum TaxID=357466 RepID=A0AAD4XQ25_9MAGN|nr:hypothetical protein MKW98_027156 [Papaver atlanticum]